MRVVVSVMLCAAAAPLAAQYGDAYRAPNYTRLTEMANARSREAMNDHYNRIAPSRGNGVTYGGTGPAVRSDPNAWGNFERVRAQEAAGARNRARVAAFDAIEQKVETLIQSRGLQKTPEYHDQLLQAAKDGGMDDYQAKRYFGYSPADYAELLRARAATAARRSTSGQACPTPCTASIPMREGGRWTGAVRDGEPDGEGRYEYPNGNVYVGRMQGIMHEGDGTWTKVDGSFDRGTWKGGRLVGPGVRFDASDSSLFVGTFANGRPAIGRYEFPKSRVTYVGTFDAEGRYAEGTWEQQGGVTFVGEHAYGVRYKGRMTFANGVVFEGFYSSGAPSTGKFTFPNGEVWHGNYKDAKKHGYAIVIRPDGSSREGIFEDDKDAGPLVITYKDGDVLTGTAALPGFTIFGLRREKATGRSKVMTLSGEGRWTVLKDEEADMAAVQRIMDEAAATLTKERERYRRAIEGS